MRRTTVHSLSLLALIVLSIAAARAEEPAPGVQVPQSLDITVGEGDDAEKVTVHFMLFLPKDFQKQESWPLMLFLHGAGERGDDLDRVTFHGPPKIVKTKTDFPFVVVSPQCPKGTWWKTDRLVPLLDHVIDKYKVDADRVVVTGLSMGGFGSWGLAGKCPERWAAVVPICGGGDPEQAEKMKDLAIWNFHGAKDRVVPIGRSEAMVNAVRDAGGQVKFTVYPEAGHNSWTQAYSTPELYEWMLEQRRPASKEGDSR